MIPIKDKDKLIKQIALQIRQSLEIFHNEDSQELLEYHLTNKDGITFIITVDAVAPDEEIH